MVTFNSTAQVTAEIEAPKLVMKTALFLTENVKCHRASYRYRSSDYLAIEEGKIMEWVGKGKIPVEKEGENLFLTAGA